jgi:phage gp36-like protein
MASAYGCTYNDLIGRLALSEIVQLADNPDAPSGVLDEAVVNDRIEAAEQEFHLKAGRYYVTPLNPLPAAVRDNLLDLAAYKLMTRRPGWLAKTAEGADYWIGRRSELTRWLDRIADRKDVIPDAAERAAMPAPSGTAGVNSEPLVFSDDSMVGLFQ